MLVYHNDLLQCLFLVAVKITRKSDLWCQQTCPSIYYKTSKAKSSSHKSTPRYNNNIDAFPKWSSIDVTHVVCLQVAGISKHSNKELCIQSQRVVADELLRLNPLCRTVMQV